MKNSESYKVNEEIEENEQTERKCKIRSLKLAVIIGVPFRNTFKCTAHVLNFDRSKTL